MKIEFKTVRYKNLLSSGNSWTTIPLNESRTTLISGTNGSGKSTLLDAIVFAEAYICTSPNRSRISSLKSV